MTHQGYGFCEFLTEEDAEYACKIMNQIKLFGKPIRVNKVCANLSTHRTSVINAFLFARRKASSDRKPLEIGANLFIGNLDPAVDERLLYETFSHFGTLTNTAKVCVSFVPNMRVSP
jgi:splicing factor 3B subunit 4